MLEDSVVQATLKGLDFSIKIDKEIPIEFFSDPDKIINVLFNLITNSIKYTQLGYINIIIKMKMNEL